MIIKHGHVTVERIAEGVWASTYCRAAAVGGVDPGYTAQSSGATEMEAVMNLADLMGTFKAYPPSEESKAYAPPEESELIPGILHSLWVHCGWRHMTQNLTTAEKELFADLVDGYMSDDEELAVGPVDRWWL